MILAIYLGTELLTIIKIGTWSNTFQDKVRQDFNMRFNILLLVCLTISIYLTISAPPLHQCKPYLKQGVQAAVGSHLHFCV